MTMTRPFTAASIADRRKMPNVQMAMASRGEVTVLGWVTDQGPAAGNPQLDRNGRWAKRAGGTNLGGQTRAEFRPPRPLSASRRACGRSDRDEACAGGSISA